MYINGQCNLKSQWLVTYQSEQDIWSTHAVTSLDITCKLVLNFDDNNIGSTPDTLA